MNSFSDDEITKIFDIKSKISTMIFDYKIHNLFAPNEYFYIAGGVFTSIFHDEPINDIDIFMLKNNHPIYNGWGVPISNYHYLDPHIKSIYEYYVSDGIKLQLIVTDYESREELVNDFDYIHSKISYCFKTNSLYISKSVYDAVNNKILILYNPKHNSEKRKEKFLSRGFTVA